MMLAVALVLACCAIEGAFAFADDAADTDDAPPPEVKPPPPPSMVKVLLAYSLAIGGLAVIAMGVVRTTGAVSYQQSKLMLTNMLRTNPNQAEQVVKSVSGNYFESLAAAMKLIGMAGTRDPKTVQATTPPAYDAAAVGISMYWKGLLAKLKLGVMAMIGAVALAVLSNINPVILILLLVLGLAGYVRLHVYKATIERDVTRARAEILPEVDRAVIEGRFWFPPPPQ